MSQESTESRLDRIDKMVQRGLKPSAAALCREILKKEPSNFEALIRLAHISSLPDEAEEALKRAAQLRPEDRYVQELMMARYPQPAPSGWGNVPGGYQQGYQGAAPNPYAPAPNPYAPPGYAGAAPNPYAPPQVSVGPNPYAPQPAPNPYAPPQPTPAPNPYAPQSAPAPNPYAPQPTPAPNPFAPQSTPAGGYGATPPANGGYPFGGSAAPAPAPPYGSQPGFPPAPSQPSSSYDYLRTLNVMPPSAPPSSVGPVPPPVPMTTPVPVIPDTKIKRGSNPVGVIFGILFLLAGVALAVLWSSQVLAFQDDVSKAGSVVEGQITKITNSKLVLDTKGQGERSYDINEQTFKTLEPLVRDAKNNQSLAPNAVKLNVSPGGRLTSVEVTSPNKGVASANASNSGLLGLGVAGDWGLTALCIVLAIIGLIILGRTLGKSRA